MEHHEWLGCQLVEIVPGRVSGAPVFRNSRLPVSVVLENVDAFMEIDGLSEDQAIAATLDCFPSTPGGPDAIRAVLAFRNAHRPQLQL